MAINGIYTTSPTVAEYFGKKHDAVLRDIRMLDCSLAFRECHFEPHQEVISYVDAGRQWRSKETSRTGHYRMSREGFLFLALAYRGAKAARIREAFITDPSSYPDDLLWENTP